MKSARYASLAWPWVALLLCLALLGQEHIRDLAGADSSLAIYHLAIMVLGVTSLALILLPPRRMAYWLGFLVCAGLIAYALYLQYVVGLEPCPLCVFQRICVIAMGLVFVVAAIRNPTQPGAAGVALLQLLIGGAGIAFAGRQVWLQSLPKDEVPACGMGLNYMLETLPYTDVIRKVFEGSGECAEKGWVLLNVSIAGWTLVFFVAIIVASFALIRRD